MVILDGCLKPQAQSLLFVAVLLLLQPIQTEVVDPVVQIVGLLGCATGCFKGTFRGSLTRILVGNLDWKFNKNSEEKGRIWRKEMKPRQGQNRWGNRNRREGIKKGIIIFLLTHAMPGTLASIIYILQ